MDKLYLIVLSAVICATDICAQQADTLEFRSNAITHETDKRTTIFNAPYSKFIIPAALISYGVATRISESLQSFDHDVHHEVSKHFKKKFSIDDYTQFAPTVAVFGLDLIGVKVKHNFRDRAIVMATSQILMETAVFTVKYTTGIRRPDNSNTKSFPSGHTATAFAGAHILFKEYKDTSPWIGVGGYTVATITGAFRVLNKRHWVSDVITGAGIGILSAEVGYMLLPVFHKILGIKNTNKSLVVVPTVSADNNYGVGLVYAF